LLALRFVKARNQTKPIGFVAHRKSNGFYYEEFAHMLRNGQKTLSA